MIKAVYSRQEDVWSVYLDSELLAKIDREHPYTKELLHNSTLRFDSRAFGERLNSLVQKRAVEFGLEALLTTTSGAKVKERDLEYENLVTEYESILEKYSSNKDLQILKLDLPPVEKISSKELLRIKVQEARRLIQEVEELTDLYKKAADILKEFDIRNPTQRLEWNMIRQELESAASLLEERFPEKSSELRMKVRFYSKILEDENR